MPKGPSFALFCPYSPPAVDDGDGIISNPYQCVKLHLSKLTPPIPLPPSVHVHLSPLPGPCSSSPTSLSSSPPLSIPSKTYILTLPRQPATIGTLRAQIASSNGWVSDPPSSPLSPYRLGPIRSGMTIAEVTAAIQAHFPSRTTVPIASQSVAPRATFKFSPFVVTKIVVVAHGPYAGTFAEVLCTADAYPTLATLHLPNDNSPALALSLIGHVTRCDIPVPPNSNTAVCYPLSSEQHLHKMLVEESHCFYLLLTATVPVLQRSAH